MNIYKRTEKLLISSNMNVKLQDIIDNKFNMNQVIQHLLDHESDIVNRKTINMELIELCMLSLEKHKDEIIERDYIKSLKRRRTRVMTFFDHSCRIIRIDLTERPRVARCGVTYIPKDTVESGYEIVPKPWAHSVLIIKLERMTDVSCFATWSLSN